MANSAPQTEIDASRSRRISAFGLFAATALLAAIPAFMAWKYRMEYLSVCIWGGALALIALGAGLFQLLSEPNNNAEEKDSTRLMFLVGGGLTGLVTLLLALALTYQWWTDYFAGGLEKWRENWWRLAICLLAMFGGLAVMFGSLLMARAEERSNPFLRRLLYGYNAVLTGLLLLAVLGLVNVLAYVRVKPFSYLGDTYDWTESSVYTLSPQSRSVLENLEKPLKVYAILPLSNDIVQREVSTLLDNCRAVVNDENKFQAVNLSPDTDREEIRRITDELRQVSKDFTIPQEEGLLLVYGTQPQVQHEFIKKDEMFSEADRAGGKPRFLFKGEDALITKVNFLEQGKTRSAIYFTQSNGELDINDSNEPDRGIGRLKEQLTRANYEVKELKFDREDTSVPADAAVLVIAKPTLPFSASALKALDTYMNPVSADPQKKGKLVVLFDVVTTREGTMVQTGLERVLAKYSVKVDDNRIFSLNPRGLGVLAITNPRSRVGRAFNNDQNQDLFLLNDVRTVRPAPSNTNLPANQYQTEMLLVVSPQFQVWTETNLRADPAALITSLLKPERRDELIEKLSREPLSVGVTVSEPMAPDASDPHGFMRAGGEQKPRLAVFGDAGWVSNRQIMDPRTGRVNADLFASTLAWLRERSNIGQMADPKERPFFVLKSDPDSGMASRLYFLPGPLMLFGIVGLGLGVWVVRRR